MIEILLILVAGVLSGVLLRRFRAAAAFGSGVTYTVWILIFVLGVSVGSDSGITSRTGAIGVSAAVVCVLATAGSVLAVVALKRFMSRRRR